jgi:hypothetical protein
MGQRLLGPSDYNHCFVVLDDRYVIQPWPSGARIRPLDDFDGELVTYGWLLGLADERRERIAAAAYGLRGVGYGTSDYVALSLYRSGWRGRWADQVSDSARLLPAQFAVEAYWRAGVYLMPDRDSHDVSLDELGNLFLSMADWELRVPCAQYV